MIRALFFAVVLTGPVVACACGDASAKIAKATVREGLHPDACAKKADLIGKNCSYTTGMMARHVLMDGAPFTFEGTLIPTDNTLDSQVAAPYMVGPDQSMVIANELLQSLVEEELETQRVQLEGHQLEVDEVTYFVLTDYRGLGTP